MVIQIDIDGTITQAPDFFKQLTHAFHKDDHKILIVSSRTELPEIREDTVRELQDYGIVYDKLILTPTLEGLEKKQLPAGLLPDHHLHAGKLIAAKDYVTDILFDDCEATIDLFRQHLPKVQVFQVRAPLF